MKTASNSAYAGSMSNLQLASFLCLAGAILDIVGMGNAPLGIFSGKNILCLLEPSKLMSFLTISNETPPPPLNSEP